MELGDKVKKHRVELGITQDELAQKLGYSDKSSISRIENTSRLPLNKVKLLADVLNVTTSYLMECESELNIDNKQSIDNKTNNIHADYSHTTTNAYLTNASLSYQDYRYGNNLTMNDDSSVSILNKDLFYELLFIVKDMNDEQLKDVILYSNFILKNNHI